MAIFLKKEKRCEKGTAQRYKKKRGDIKRNKNVMMKMLKEEEEDVK